MNGARQSLQPPAPASQEAPERNGRSVEAVPWAAQWRHLSEEEAHAIQESDWPRLLHLQQQKSELQRAIAAAEIRPEGAGLVRYDPEELGALLELERRNLLLLESRRRTADAERDRLEKSRRDLRRLQREFGVHSEPTWQSYS